MAYFLGLVLALAGFWLSMSGHNEPLILTLGVVSLALCCILAYRLDIIDREGAPYVRLAGFQFALTISHGWPRKSSRRTGP